MALPINTGSQHAALPINARVDKKKIVILGKAMFINQMAASLLPIATHFVAALDEASERLFATVTLGCDDGIVVFRNVQLEEVSRGEVGFAFGAPVAVGLIVVSLILGI